MKILVVGDTHGNAAWLQNSVVPHAVRLGAEKIVQVGDFGFVWDGTAGGLLDKLNKVLDTADLDLVFLPGNHENYDLLGEMQRQSLRNDDGHWLFRPRVAYTGKVSRWSWAGRSLAAVGGAVSVDRAYRLPGRSWWPQEVLSPLESAHAMSLGSVELLFSHDCPVHHPFSLSPDSDSQAHRALMTDVARSLSPRLWFHGHYHIRAEYSFRHGRGEAEVVGLDCDGTDLAGATSLLDLAVQS